MVYGIHFQEAWAYISAAEEYFYHLQSWFFFSTIERGEDASSYA
jgi:hypothetical protein